MRTGPMESIEHGYWGLTEAETAVTEPAWVCTKCSAYTLWLLSLEFMWNY